MSALDFNSQTINSQANILTLRDIRSQARKTLGTYISDAKPGRLRMVKDGINQYGYDGVKSCVSSLSSSLIGGGGLASIGFDMLVNAIYHNYIYSDEECENYVKKLSERVTPVDVDSELKFAKSDGTYYGSADIRMMHNAFATYSIANLLLMGGDYMKNLSPYVWETDGKAVFADRSTVDLKSSDPDATIYKLGKAALASANPAYCPNIQLEIQQFVKLLVDRTPISKLVNKILDNTGNENLKSSCYPKDQKPLPSMAFNIELDKPDVYNDLCDLNHGYVLLGESDSSQSFETTDSEVDELPFAGEEQID